MSYKFTSKSAGDLIMLEPDGRRLLEIIGKDAAPRGIILPDEIDAAVHVQCLSSASLALVGVARDRTQQ